MSYEEDAKRMYVVQVRPEGVGPEHWPSVYRHLGKKGCTSPANQFLVDFRWASLTAGGGYSIGISLDAVVIGDKAVQDRVEEWIEEHDEDFWAYEFRMVKVQ
ncbi:hypothetical protein LCGC14_2888150 [marine sediment metagenome]|uniref:Uncharacterized protein n=1 Tax=marine sediment metagenome TaxID=412755 RepID=A0A0F9AP72_9ZZZZ